MTLRLVADAPSPWVVRWSAHIRPGGRVLDVAAGSGRHSRYLAEQGLSVVAVDRDIAALRDLPHVTPVQADLEAAPWPFSGERFDAIIVTNYLHRPLFPHLLEALAPGGVLIYETFMVGNEAYGRPSNPEFLLETNELLRRVNLRVLSFEQGYTAWPKPAMVQRLCAQATE